MIHPSTANCFPSTCNQSDVQRVLTNYFLWANFTTDYNVIPSVGNCATDEKPTLGAGVVVMM